MNSEKLLRTIRWQAAYNIQQARALELDKDRKKTALSVAHKNLVLIKMANAGLPDRIEEVDEIVEAGLPDIVGDVSVPEIRFYGRTYASHQFLSNFHSCTLLIDNRLWPSVEHYYQAMKTENFELQEMIRLAPTAAIAKKMGAELDLRSDWELKKETFMLTALREKYTDGKLRQRLLDTDEAVLIEASPTDYYWGEGTDKTGLNRLGALSMQVRYEIKTGKAKPSAV
jgi:ribA/ribD-fused uncharacterized protein